MFTNGMRESSSTKVYLKEVSPEAFKVMLDYMYSGELTEDIKSNDTLLLHILLLADQFGITLLQQECCKLLLECLYEVALFSLFIVYRGFHHWNIISFSHYMKFWLLDFDL